MCTWSTCGLSHVLQQSSLWSKRKPHVRCFPCDQNLHTDQSTYSRPERGWLRTQTVTFRLVSMAPSVDCWCRPHFMPRPSKAAQVAPSMDVAASWLSPRPGRPFSPCVTSGKWGYSRLHSLMIKFGLVGWLWELNPLLHTKGLGLCLGCKQSLPLTKPMLSVYCLWWVSLWTSFHGQAKRSALLLGRLIGMGVKLPCNGLRWSRVVIRNWPISADNSAIRIL